MKPIQNMSLEELKEQVFHMTKEKLGRLYPLTTQAILSVESLTGSLIENHPVIFTDGAVSRNGKDDSVAGAAAILVCKTKGIAIGRYVTTKITPGTNNIAELQGIIIGIKALTKKCHVTIVSDSTYAIGALLGRNKVKANKELITYGKEIIEANTESAKFIHTNGHAGQLLNELADRLAVSAKEV